MNVTFRMEYFNTWNGLVIHKVFFSAQCLIHPRGLTISFFLNFLDGGYFEKNR